MRKQRIAAALMLLLFLACSAVSAYADGTVLTTTVPSTHRVDLQILGEGTVTVDGQSYTGDAALDIERLSEAEYSFSPAPGYMFSQVLYGGKDVTSQVTNGQYRAAAINADSSLKVVFTKLEGAYAEVYGSSLSLKGNIGLNFYVIPSAELLADSGAYVSLGSSVYPFSEAATRVIEGETLYQFSVSLNAKQMTNKIVLRACKGDGTRVILVLRGSCVNLTKTGYSYSIQDYFSVARTKTDDPKLLALLDAMSDYGSMAQLQFNYRISSRVPVKADLSQVSLADLESYQATITPGKVSGVTYQGNSLLLQSETVLRFYFTVDSGSIGDYSFKLGKKAITPVQSGDRWYVEVPDIHAKDLDTFYTVTVSSSEGKILTVKACALSYACSVLSSGDSSDTLKDTVRSLYLYNKAANAWFG